MKICGKDINVESDNIMHLNRGGLEGKDTMSMAGQRIKGASSSMTSSDNVAIVKEQEHDNINENVNFVHGLSEEVLYGIPLQSLLLFHGESIFFIDEAFLYLFE